MIDKGETHEVFATLAGTHRRAGVQTASTSIEAELDVQLPPGQTSVDQSQFVSEMESSSGEFSERNL